MLTPEKIDAARRASVAPERYFDPTQFARAIEAAATAPLLESLLEKDKRIDELEELCGEAYQVVGSLLSDVGAFESPEAERILDNLSQATIVHKDVLPWPSFSQKQKSS